jgi:hypothetical protein
MCKTKKKNQKDEKPEEPERAQRVSVHDHHHRKDAEKKPEQSGTVKI